MSTPDETKTVADARTPRIVVAPSGGQGGALPPGRVVGGFRVKRLLGKGGMGEVYLAEQMSMGREVALKILPATLAPDPKDVQRFLGEIRMAARLDHPNIVAAHEAGEDNGVYFLAMTYVPGESLKDRLEHGGPLAEAEALRIGRDVAGALDYAWREHHMLHRDIKPGNIMIEPGGKVRVTDMGLAKSLLDSPRVTLSNALVGTPAYMSPEQVDGRSDPDARSDIYALGVTLYHALTGAMPFDGLSLTAVLHKKTTEDLPDVRALRANVSEATALLLAKMTARNPEQRPPDWRAVIAEIDAMSAGGVVAPAAVPTSPPCPPDSGRMVFISYASEDQAMAVRIREALERQGLSCWIALRDVGPGQRYGEEIVKAIEAARALVLVLSEHANRSDAVANEVERAFAEKKRIIPVRLANVQPAPSLKFFISQTQWINLWDGAFAQRMQVLAEGIKAPNRPGAEGAGVPRPAAARRSRVARAALAGCGVLIALVAVFTVVRGRPPAPAVAGAETAAPAVTNAIRYHALAIGINDYAPLNGRGWASLRTARDDAAALADLLEAHYGFRVTRLLDREAGRAAILAALDTATALGPDDALLVYFAGHGYYEPSSGEGYWIPADARREEDGRLPKPERFS